MTRTDIHRPSVLEPLNYQFVAFECVKCEGGPLENALFLQAEHAMIRSHMARTGGTYSHHAHGGNCHICGAHAIYTALFHHTPSNVYVRTGLDCAEKLECGDIAHFRANVRTALENQAGKRKARTILELAGLDKAWEVFESDVDGKEEAIIRNMIGNLVRYGNISDKQIAFLKRLVHHINNRAEIEAARAAERDAAKPVPVTDERIAIRGTILSVRVPNIHEGEFGPDRILVQHAEGWKVWGSMPKGLNAKRGDEIELSASVTVSERDSKFGFFKRPNKARIVIPAAKETEAA